MKRGLLFYLQLALAVVVALFLIVPVVLSVLAGLTVNYFRGLSSGLTLHWVAQVWMLYSDTVYRSLYIALACLAATLVIGVPAAYVLAKRRNRLTRLVEELLVLPIAIPGLAIALGLLISYGGFRDFRASWLFILVGHVLFTLPFMVRAVLAVLGAIDLKSLEEGAASLGAGLWKRLVTVVLPNCRSGILAGALMVVTLSIGEFNLTWMLHTPLTKTLPVGLADSYASMRIEIGSAYTLIFLVMIVPLLLLLQRLSGLETRPRSAERRPAPVPPPAVEAARP
ncbi:MAG TPA: ABC transporter permease subunit [Alphaproteobacteria bacterium]|nr:ABC transporter permease subunit [Alphaproteobacteria bacterium]